MFDTMVFTKIVGAFCGALLVFLLGQWAADELYKTSRPGMEQAYVIDTGDDVDEEPEAERSFAELLQVADASAGSRQWNQCRACHVMAEGEHGVGPSLYKVVGSEIAAIDAFNYSGALPDGVWTPEELSAFIEAPREYAPGTSMGYAGMASAEDRANLIAYIIEESGDQVSDFVEAAAEETDAQEEAVEEAATEAEPAEDGVSDFARLVASVDPDDGARVWNQCRACHALEDGDNRVGPHLYDLIGRVPGSVEGFNYSGALSEAADVWNYDTLSALLEDPRGFAPGTTMAYAGLGDEEDRASLIAYIVRETGGDPAEHASVDDAAARTEPAEEDDATEEAMAEDESEFARLVASFGPDDGGARLWNQCRACHVMEDGQNRVGPHLFEIVGREVDSVEGFNYSGALSEAADVWDYDALSALLEDPRGFAPGTTMAYAGMADEEDRAKLIAYIEAESQ